MKEKRYMTIIKSLLLAAASFVFLSCSNLFGDSSLESSSSENASSDKAQTITITGNISISEELKESGALPAEYLFLFNQINDSNERSAFPSTSSTNYYATATAEGKNAVNGTITTTATGASFTMAIPIDDTSTDWTIEAGLKDTFNTSTVTILKDTFSKSFSNTDPSFSHDFIIRPLTEGSGNIDLTISSTTSTANTPDTLELYLNGTKVTAGTGETISTSKITLKNRATGTYKARLVFKKNGYVVFTDYQGITVFPNMTTNTWVNSKFSTSVPINGSTYTLTDPLVQDYRLTQIYVGSVTIGTTTISGNDTSGNGTIFAPFATFAKAITFLKENGNSFKDYTIWICGEISGAQTISDGTTESPTPILAKSLTISGYSGNTADKLKGGDSGSVLYLDTSKSVKITNLTITGGKGTTVDSKLYGGGIYINKGSVELTTGVVVDGNTADVGGGVYLADGTLYLNDTAVVGKPLTALGANPTCAGTTSGTYANMATEKGGGIAINEGTLWLGYRPPVQGESQAQAKDTSGGVIYNLVTSTGATQGGGIDNYNGIINIVRGVVSYNYASGTGTGSNDVGSGGGISTTKTLDLQGNAEISHNESAYGGAVYIGNGGSFTMSAGTIKENASKKQHTKWGDGGGIAIGGGGNFYMSGGTVSSNTAEGKGGAVYHTGTTFEISGNTATIPKGDNEKNNIQLETTSQKIKITGPTNSGDGGIALTPARWNRGDQIFDNGSTTSYFSKFTLTDPEWNIVVYNDGTNDSGRLTADIYVSDSGNDDNIGTSSHPLKTIAKAAKVCCPCETEIKVVGTFTASAASDLQSIPNSDDITVSSIKLTGTGSGATIDANSKGSAFTINKAILVNIENITIKGGNTSSNGAGLNVAVSGAKVNLGNNVVIKENKASGNGGGVYVASGAILCLNGSSIIGNSGGNRPANTSVEPNSSNGINKANYGGGIYCSGTLGIGKSVNSSGTLSNSSFSGGIYTNLSVSHGGGIYLTNTSTLSTNGSYIISKNRAGDFGAGIYYASTNALSLSSATFTNNEARGGGAIIIPIGNNIDITVSGGTYTSNSATNGAGGAIHSESTGLLKLEGSVSFTSNTGYDVYGGGAFSHMGSIVFNSTNISIPYGGSKGSNGVWVAPGKYIELKQVLSNHNSTNQIGINGTVDNQVLGGSKLNANIEKFKIADDGYYIDTSGYMRQVITETYVLDSITSQSQIETYASQMLSNGSTRLGAIDLNEFDNKLIYFTLYTDDNTPAYGVITFTSVDYMGACIDYEFKRFKNNLLEIDAKGTIYLDDYENFPSTELYLGLNETYLTAGSEEIAFDNNDDQPAGDLRIDKDENSDSYLLYIGMDGTDGYVGYYSPDLP